MIAVWLRIGAVLIVVLVHIVLLLILAYRQRRESVDESSMQLVLVPIEAPPREEVPALKAAIERSAKENHVGTNERALEPSKSVPSAPSIDWHASAATAADDAIAKHLREERYRNFGPRKPTPVEPEPPSIFKTPKHQAGDIERDELGGVARVYHSEHCFTELAFPTLREPGGSSDAASRINFPRCMYPVGKAEASGDLFDHLKKARPWPNIKPGTETGPLPERKESNESQ
jgi:hypothetical protein